MDHIARVLPRVLHRRGISAHATASLIVHRAQLWLSDRIPKLKQTIHVSTLRDGVLFVECDHSIAAQECTEASAELQSFLTKEFGPRITAVRVMRKKHADNTELP